MNAESTSKQRKSARDLGRQGPNRTPPQAPFEPPEDLDTPMATHSFHGAPPIVHPMHRQRMITPSEPSEVGAKPLVDDMKLGWDTGIKPQQGMIRPAGTRLPSELASYTIESGHSWLVVAIVILVAAGGGITAILLWS